MEKKISFSAYILLVSCIAKHTSKKKKNLVFKFNLLIKQIIADMSVVEFEITQAHVRGHITITAEVEVVVCKGSYDADECRSTTTKGNY